MSSKNESLFLQRKNPRKIAWTVVYRRLHKKGVTEEVAKKRTRKTVKHQRGIVGASLEQINARRNQKPEVRAAARQAAVAKSKEDKKAKAEVDAALGLSPAESEKLAAIAKERQALIAKINVQVRALLTDEQKAKLPEPAKKKKKKAKVGQ